ncbi:hypothetical protein AZE42_13262 [Rhizopogon vesiculosus]|uniref:Uncharacterized protein n=1 Tax=Rhizopogon vesiculosus TaxID=180088 RepID=A0A1J8PUJ8_9AGAM|nr:hypothetical protein AZE42_13262 [Rhizopogon vesiculosus]
MKASAEVGPVDSDLDSDSNENTTALERPVKKARMELQVASSSKRITPFDRMYVTEGKKAPKEHGDNALMLFVTCTGVPPHVIDSAEFKVFCSTLNANYKPPSATTLSDRLIPNECARIIKEMVDHLKTERDLTITFDGGKIRKPKSFYTVHVTTGDRRTALLELDDASMLSHTARYIGELLDSV